MALALPVAAHAANDWVPLAGISATTTLVTNSLCYTDGTDLVCDGAAGLAGSGSGDRIVSGTLAMTVNSATSIVSLSTDGTTWGYLGSAASYLPYLNSLGVSSTNISVTTINGVAASSLGSASPTNVPAFSVHRNGSAQTVTASTWAKILFTTEEFDTYNNFDTSTSRFTPTVAGKYLLDATLFCQSSTACNLAIRKNGTDHLYNLTRESSGMPHISGVVDMNGTTDYVEVWGYNTGGTSIDGASYSTRFSGSLLASGNGLVSGTGATALSGLSDVTLSSPATGQVLAYNGSVWVNSPTTTAAATTFAALTDVSVSLVGTNLYGPGSLNGAVAGYTANTAYGVNSLSSTLLAGSGNSGFGTSALRNIRGGSVNTAMGYHSLYSLTSGSNNTAVGGEALYSVTAGGYNSALGRYTLNSNTGEYNSALGANALRNKTSGNYNTAAGYYAGYGAGGISYGNAFFGAYAGQAIGTGGSNTLVGYNAGGGISTGSANILLGADTSPYSNTGSYQLNIGNALWGDVGSGLGYANKIGINITSPTTNFGVSGTTYLSGITGIGASPNASYALYVGGNAYSTGTWGTSDARFKENVQTLAGLLAKVDQLRPVTFTWKKDSFAAKGNEGEQIGVIAQEVEAVFPDLVKTGADGYKAVAYDKLSVLLLGAVKELKSDNDNLKAQNAALDARLKALECKVTPGSC